MAIDHQKQDSSVPTWRTWAVPSFSLPTCSLCLSLEWTTTRTRVRMIAPELYSTALAVEYSQGGKKTNKKKPPKKQGHQKRNGLGALPNFCSATIIPRLRSLSYFGGSAFHQEEPCVKTKKMTVFIRPPKRYGPERPKRADRLLANTFPPARKIPSPAPARQRTPQM